MRLFIIIMIIAVILSISKFLMDLTKKEDKSKGLEINENEYTILKSATASGNEEKRIKREKMSLFQNYKITNPKWKLSLRISLIILVIAVITGFIFDFSTVPLFLSMLLIAWAYIGKRPGMIVLLDVYIFLCIIFIRDKGHIITTYINLPFAVYNTYMIFSEYKKFKKES